MGKRKLDENNVPAQEASDVAEAGESAKKESKHEKLSFESLNLDSRLMQALTEQKFTKPTLIQSEAIPLALEGKDVLGMYLDILFAKFRSAHHTNCHRFFCQLQHAQRLGLERQPHMFYQFYNQYSSEKPVIRRHRNASRRSFSFLLGSLQSRSIAS